MKQRLKRVAWLFRWVHGWRRSHGEQILRALGTRPDAQWTVGSIALNSGLWQRSVNRQLPNMMVRGVVRRTFVGITGEPLYAITEDGLAWLRDVARSRV